MWRYVRFITHHSIAAVVAKYDNVNRTGVIGHTDTSFFGSILSAFKKIKSMSNLK